MLWRILIATVLPLWTSLLPAVCARECGVVANYSTSITVWSQDDADIKLDGCTTLVSSVIIGHNYTGDLILKGVTNLTRGLRTSTGNRWDEPGVPGLTSVSAPDLLEVGYSGLFLENSIALKSVSFEKLQKVYDLRLEFNTGDGSMDFPKLETIEGHLLITGNFTSMNFGSLTNVGSIVSVRAQPDRQSSSDDNPYIGSNPPMEVDFPSLVNCSEFTIVGNLSRVSAPKLSTVADSIGSSTVYFVNSPKLTIYTKGLPLDLDFPSLWNTSRIDLAGTIANFSLPALKHIDRFIITRSLPMGVNLSPLESADTIFLYGNVTDYNFSSLTNVTGMISISSELSIDCDPAKKAWLNLHPEYAESKGYIPGYYCSGPYKAPKKPFLGGKLALGLGIGVPFLLIVAWIWSGSIRNKRKEKAQAQLPDYETEMETRRTGGGEVLPKYAPPAGPSSTDARSSVTSLSDMARPTERPPGYVASHAQEGGQATQSNTQQRTGAT